MSAKRSYDVEAKGRGGKGSSSRKATKTRSAPARRASSRPKSLRERRESASQIKNFFLFLLCVAVVGGAFYLLWRPEARISSIRVPDSGYEDAIEKLAFEKMTGTYYSVFPKDSFFFYPEREIKEAILEAYPRLSKISISRAGFTSLSIGFESRASAFVWCGAPEDASLDGQSCYEADEHGFIFASYTEQAGATTTDMLQVYAVLDTASSTGAFPLRARVLGTEKIPGILKFSRTLQAYGTPLRFIAIRADEADIFTEGGTRITYVIGKEREAGESAAAALPKLNLKDGSIEYVDLRFPGKIYLKRADSAVVEE